MVNSTPLGPYMLKFHINQFHNLIIFSYRWISEFHKIVNRIILSLSVQKMQDIKDSEVFSSIHTR